MSPVRSLPFVLTLLALNAFACQPRTDAKALEATSSGGSGDVEAGRCASLVAAEEAVLRDDPGCGGATKCGDPVRYRGYTKSTYCGAVRLTPASAAKVEALDRELDRAKCVPTAYASCPPAAPSPR